ncbi:MAG: hypothetical protein HY690_14840 [Chloroflexi bacterium]|nr:hypothetical protein [Chloroflexota bacterium]
MRHPVPLALCLCTLWLVAACGRPLDRPLSGAAPPSGDYTPAPVYQEQAPPTLAPPTRVAQKPAREQAPTPTPVASALPILRNLQPSPNARVAVGEVRIAAQITSFSNLAEVTATLNGQPVQVEVAGRDERSWTAFFSRKLEAGEHEVRLVAQDDQGRRGGYRWQFTVVPSDQSTSRAPSPVSVSPVAAPVPPGQTPVPSPSPAATPPPRPAATPAS